jgi:flagellar hook-basal body complex protein FliE
MLNLPISGGLLPTNLNQLQQQLPPEMRQATGRIPENFDVNSLRNLLPEDMAQRLRGINGTSGIEGLEGPRTVRPNVTGESFGRFLSQAIGSVDQNMKIADTNVQDFIAGKNENVHEVMISMQRAQLSFQLLVEVRNKAIETYQEINRMQI